VAAAPLFLSPETVGFHLGSIHRKLGASSRPQLVHLLLQPKGPKTTDSNLGILVMTRSGNQVSVLGPIPAHPGALQMR
jgi:regulatory LuxR family protein